MITLITKQCIYIYNLFVLVQNVLIAFVWESLEHRVFYILYVNKEGYIYIYIYVCKYVCTYVCMYVCKYVYIVITN